MNENIRERAAEAIHKADEPKGPSWAALGQHDRALYVSLADAALGVFDSALDDPAILRMAHRCTDETTGTKPEQFGHWRCTTCGGRGYIVDKDAVKRHLAGDPASPDAQG